MLEYYFENENGETGMGAFAKSILGSVVEETPFNREALNSWRELAVSENVNELYNTNECCYD